MNLKDIRIGKRLFIAFGILELLMVALIIIGARTTVSMNGRLEDIVNEHNALIDAAYNVKDGVVTINLTTLASIMTKDEAYKAKSGDVVAANRAKYKAATETIEKLEETAEGKELLKKIKDGIVTGRAGNNKAMELSKAGKVDEAVAAYTGEVLPTSTRIFENCDALISFEQKRTAGLANEAHSAYIRTLILIIGTGVLALALATGLTLTLAKSIIEPIKKTIAQAKLLAQGNLTQHIVVDRADEFGEQAAAMKGMVEKWREIIGKREADFRQCRGSGHPAIRERRPDVEGRRPAGREVPSGRHRIGRDVPDRGRHRPERIQHRHYRSPGRDDRERGRHDRGGGGKGSAGDRGYRR